MKHPDCELAGCMLLPGCIDRCELEGKDIMEPELTNEMNDRKELTDGLRALADWYDAHPEITIPSSPEFVNYATDTKEDAAKVLRAMSPCKKEYIDSLFVVSRMFGSINAKFYFMRNTVCVRKVVGTKEIPEKVIPAQPETVIPAKVEEIVEWECEPVLSRQETA